MNRKGIIKIFVDIGMTLLLLLLMAYSLVGVQAHEWLGVGIFVLFVVHHALNRKWTRSVVRGRYTAVRSLQTGLAFCVMTTMVGSMVSGVLLSRYVFAVLPISGGRSFARTLHMLSAYWGFVFMSLHLGFHWNLVLSMARRAGTKPSNARSWLIRSVGILIAGYGIYAFAIREIGSYLLFRTQFVFFDFEEPLGMFLLDYVAVMGLFVFIGHYGTEGLKRLSR